MCQMLCHKLDCRGFSKNMSSDLKEITSWEQSHNSTLSQQHSCQGPDRSSRGQGQEMLFLEENWRPWASFTEDMNRNNSLEITRGYQIPKEREVVSGKRRATWKGPEAGECAVC